MPTRLLVLVSVLALVLTACPSGEEPGAEPDGEPVEETDGADWATCTNEAAGYTVGYPADWETNEADLLDACQVFDPGPLDLPDEPRDLPLDLAVTIRLEPVAFDRLVGEDMSTDVVEHEDLEIAGRTAARDEVVASGDGLVPEGTQFTRYAIDLDGETLVAASYDVGEPAYDRKVEVLDEMMGTLQLAAQPAEEPDQDTEPLVEQRTLEDSTEEAGGHLLTVTDVRIGTHAGFDRVVFEVAGEGPAGWLVHYVDEPRTQGRGDIVDIDGQAFLEVIIRGVALPPDAPDQDPWGGERIAGPEAGQVVELVDDGIFEGQHVFHIGLRDRQAFGVVRLEDPQRIVVEIDHG